MTFLRALSLLYLSCTVGLVMSVGAFVLAVAGRRGAIVLALGGAGPGGLVWGLARAWWFAGHTNEIADFGLDLEYLGYWAKWALSLAGAAVLLVGIRKFFGRRQPV